MVEISAEIQLRPTRIGFLVRPNNLASVRAIMRAGTCLWGGIYNPIIPVFRKAPTEWRPMAHERFKGVEVAKGYVRYFEPDVYVEAESGLAEEAGLGALRQRHSLHPQILTLKELFEAEDGRDWGEPKLGLSIHDVLRHVYKTEQQFVHREKRENLLVGADGGSALTEAIFGVYPTSRSMTYVQRGYVDVFKPERLHATPGAWRKHFLKGAITPLDVTRHGLNAQRYWHHDLLLFVFDPTRATDLIDLWNLRLEPRPVLPIPVGWFEDLRDDIYKLLKAEHRPVIGNPNGIMHNATIEFSRSMSRTQVEGLMKELKPGLPQGAVSIKHWRNSIWIDHRDDRVHRDRRLKVTAQESRVEFTLSNSLHATFETLTPDFADRFGHGHRRWINALRISHYGDKPVATLLPFNTFDRAWPRLGSGADAIPIGTEGWVFPQRYENLGQYISLLSADDAIVGWLATLGIKAELSEPGHIAKQMLEHLGGLWGVHLLADVDTLKLLNKMAGGLRRRRNEEEIVEENFELRTAPLKVWNDLIARRRGSLPAKLLEGFTSRNLIRLGVQTECPHCMAKNWSTLTVVDYRVTCERCLKLYDFPQASLREHNRNWTYRVVGPFSVPDYGRGSYAALLALRVISNFRSGMDNLTFATAMKLSFDGIQREVDFIAWYGDHSMIDERRPPTLVVGEAKSLGRDELITAKDLTKLKAVAAKLPGAIVVVAVLRDQFTVAEKRLLSRFVKWGRRANVYGEPTNPVLLLTSNELTVEHYISGTWKALGGPHAKFADYEHTKSLMKFADATQQIYLGMRSFDRDREEYWKKRHARRKSATKRLSEHVSE